MKRKSLIILFCMMICAIMKAQTANISTVVGNGTQGFDGDGGPAINAEIYWPANLAFDKYDNMFIADQRNNRIRRVDGSSGLISTIAGDSHPGYIGDSLPATDAELNLPAGVSIDTSGNVFIADFNNNRVREVVYSTGYIYTLAGNGVGGYSGDGGPATAAEIDHPHHTSVDKNQNVYFADENNNRIRRIDRSTGIITTVAGNGTGGFSGDGFSATAAMLHGPKCVAIDDSGNLFIADWLNNRIRKVFASTGNIATVAGNGATGYCCDGGPATDAELTDPYRVAIDSADNFYIADGPDNRIRWVSASTGIIHTLAGNGIAGFSGDGGAATDAELNFPPGLAFNHKGNLFVADIRNNRIREINVANELVSSATDSSEVSIFPNPASIESMVYFKYSNTPAILSLFTLTGQLIWTINKGAFTRQVNVPLDELNPGIYLLQIQIEGIPDICKQLEVMR